MKIKYVLFVFLLIVIVGLPVYVLPRIVQVREFTCESQFGDCSKSVAEQFESFEGGNYLTAKRFINSKVKESNLVREHSIQFRLPDMIDIAVIENTAKFAVFHEASGSFAALDSSGKVISITNQTNLPFVSSSEKIPNVGQFVNEHILFAAQITRSVSTIYRINNSEVREGRLIVDTEDGLRVIFPLEGDREALLGSLVLIHSRLKQDNEDFRIEKTGGVEEIDLRFKNPVLR